MELWHLIPAHLHRRIQQVSIAHTLPDRLVYAPNDHGNFSTKTFVALRWSGWAERCWERGIWAPFIPPNISNFLWKLLRHAFPVDTRVQSRGISLVSGCHCCRDRSEETLFHLFILSEVARQVWKFFANFSKLPSEYSLILQALNIWMVGSSTK